MKDTRKTIETIDEINADLKKYEEDWSQVEDRK